MAVTLRHWMVGPLLRTELILVMLSRAPSSERRGQIYYKSCPVEGMGCTDKRYCESKTRLRLFAC